MFQMPSMSGRMMAYAPVLSVFTEPNMRSVVPLNVAETVTLSRGMSFSLGMTLPKR